MACAIELSDVEARGKQIYLNGVSPSGEPILAFLGTDRIELPASAAPCGNCHGIDGRGRPEGGVVPANITWSELSKGYGHEHAFGRRHPEFDEASLAVSILGGTDPAGNTLEVAMPRYQMLPEDIDALIAYIKRLEYDFGPGVSEQVIRIGTLLPLSGPAASQGQAIREVLTAFFREINTGGVNGRQVELEVIPLGASPAETAGNVQRVLASSSLFALVASYIPVGHAELAASLAQFEIPVIGPVSRTPDEDRHRLAQAFYLYSGTPELMRSLLQFSRVEDPGEHKRQVIVGPESTLLRDVSETLADDETRRTETLPYTTVGFEAAGTAALLHDTDDVFFLGAPAELGELFAALAVTKTWPRVFLPAAIATPQLLNAPVGFDGRVFVAYPTRPGDVTDSGQALFARLGANGQLSTAHVASQVAALAAARILVEAMQRVGHGLNREQLMSSLEGMNAYPTGLSPPVTFNLNRRIGARGAHIVTLDLEAGLLVPAAAWIELP